MKKHFVNENWLLAQIKSLNNLIETNNNTSEKKYGYVSKRNYYVAKTIELSESSLNFVDV